MKRIGDYKVCSARFDNEDTGEPYWSAWLEKELPDGQGYAMVAFGKEIGEDGDAEATYSVNGHTKAEAIEELMLRAQFIFDGMEPGEDVEP
jgi:hypothetical protein